MENIPDWEVKNFCQSIFAKFKVEEEQSQSNEKNDYNSTIFGLFSHPEYAYILPWNLRDMSALMIAEQLTLVDAVRFCCLIFLKIFCRELESISSRVLSSLQKKFDLFCFSNKIF